MSDIVVNNHYKIDPKLNEAELAIVEASIDIEIVKNVSKNKLAKRIKDSIKNSLAALGNKSITEEDQLIMLNQLVPYLQMRNQYDRLKEIELAIQLGSCGEFKKDGEVLYLSVANVISWIKSYKLVKAETMKKQFLFEEKQKAKEQEEKKSKMAKYEFYRDLGLNVSKATRETCKIGFVYFEKLWKLKLIRLDKEQIDNYKKEAKIQVNKELREKKVNMFKVGDDNISNMISKRAKDLAFFDWVEQNKDFGIKELIDSKVSEVVDLQKLKSEFYE
jgi:hypothetical protein